ncbi:glutamate 5-kinase [Treponema phagedenis]|uniref:Glutamate 5-kinase n=1 Tax=Treponema phagedenis TaxID=162 RepID=A0A0B7GZ15_TREPH|nr:glutamate 5-kinase [Treponema phagedenis]NVP22781.1 glutamate 5-kinase [Treponema phagedenis]QEK01118.1 glutamate 5-kinase [Treponema phagedenis]QEK03878.1 glutamate 5-kinase [Treponema phagedenis]QEK06127.1 glutamate 5-kinase [Treponema phagedenis]QEK09493.1 glutamate 5-kinase [Treponema phagedenis]
MIDTVFNAARKIVIKIGSNTLANADGSMNLDFITAFSESCMLAKKQGKEIIIVSSGAQIAGLSTIGSWKHNDNIHRKQALCAIGQVELIDTWRNAFARFGVHIGQLLLIKDDFSNEQRRANIKGTLFSLLEEDIVPIINENDSISFDEIKIGDNDNLSALTAILWQADLLILLSDIDGIYDKNPKEHPNATRIPIVKDIPDLLKNISIGGTNSFGTGGIVTKIEAASKTLAHGIPLLLANGNDPSLLQKLGTGSCIGTMFVHEN